MVRDVMAAAALDFEAIDRVAVTTGPGTFTGTRIGISAALGFSLVRRVSVVGASSLALMASQAAELLPLAGRGGSGRGRRCATRSGLHPALRGRRPCCARPPLLLDVADAARLGGDRPIVLVGRARKRSPRRLGERSEAAAELPDRSPTHGISCTWHTPCRPPPSRCDRSTCAPRTPSPTFGRGFGDPDGTGPTAISRCGRPPVAGWGRAGARSPPCIGCCSSRAGTRRPSPASSSAQRRWRSSRRRAVGRSS